MISKIFHKNSDCRKGHFRENSESYIQGDFIRIENSPKLSFFKNDNFKNENLPYLLLKFRARSLDRLSMKSDATGSIKSQSMPDIIIFMSVASPCTSCRRPLYEEEIMAGWSHDDADYYTKCCWCNKVRICCMFRESNCIFRERLQI